MNYISKKEGYRGYIASRAIREQIIPQHIQNLVIRDYAEKNKLHYKLSATEYSMKNCSMIFESVLAQINSLEGIILYSMFQLPRLKKYRLEVYKKILNSKSSLHAASEKLQLDKEVDVERWENIILVDYYLNNSLKEKF